MAALNHTFCLGENQFCNLDVTVGRLVESGSYDLGIDAASHVGHLLWTLVDEQDNHVGVGVVLRYGVGNVFKQDGFTRLWRSNDESALTLADW